MRLTVSKKTLDGYLVDSSKWSVDARISFERTGHDRGAYYVNNEDGKCVGLITTHVDDILWAAAFGAHGAIKEILESRSGALKEQSQKFTHVGMELEPLEDYSVRISQREYISRLEYLKLLDGAWARRAQPLDPGQIESCQSKLGELSWVATTSRPDLCVRVGDFTTRINALLA